MPLRNVVAEAGAEAAPAAMGGSPARRFETIEMAGRRGPRRAASRFQFLSARCGAWPGCTPITTAFTKRQQKLADYVTNPNIAIVSYFMCGRKPMRRRGRRADGIPFFQFRAALSTASSRGGGGRNPARSMFWDEYEKWKLRQYPEAHARGLVGWAHRLARDAAAQNCCASRHLEQSTR